MPRQSLGFVVLISCMIVGGCAGQQGPLPDDPDQLILYSLDGTNEVIDNEKLAKAKMKGEFLYTFPVLGKVIVTDENQKREILSAINHSLKNPPAPSKCFWPRHAVRTVKGDQTRDFVVCFECHTYFVYHGVEPEGAMMTPAIAGDPEPLFDRILADAGVPLAEKSFK